jgi:hypothetical protein
MSQHITDPAHVENSSQAALPRKRFHHEFMHDLKNQRNGLASKYATLHGAYAVDNQPRRVDILVWIVAAVIHGADA